MALKMLLIALAVSLLAMNPANAALINVENLCNETITACVLGDDPVRSYVLSAGGGYQQLKVGNRWRLGSVYGFPGSGSSEDCEKALFQADVAEIDIEGGSSDDSYRINNMFAYNLPLAIIPQENRCRSISCAIPDLRSFCQAPNGLTGSPGDGCENFDGHSADYPTSGTIPFKIACPNAVSYIDDNEGTGFTCRTGSNYGVTFCPGNAVGTEILQVASAATS